MERSAEKGILDIFCEEFCKIIEKHAKYCIVAGYVAIASGRVRGTEDIDMILKRMSKQEFIKLHRDLENNNFVCMQSNNPEEVFDQYLEDNISVRYTWKDKPLPEMEVKFAKDELDNYVLRHRIKLPETNLNIWFATIESTIAFKEEYLKSDKDIEDARHLRLRYKELISEDEISHVKQIIRRVRP